MTAETDHHPSGPLLLALTLAGLAGFVDAHLFLYVTNVFVANMSGNMVRTGIFVGAGTWSAAGGSIAALIAFVFGVIVAITHHDRLLVGGKKIRPDELLIVEALLTLALPVIVIALNVEFSPDAQPIHYLVISLGAFAMGIQASSLRRVGEVAVATTYGTGTIVRIGEKAALVVRRAEHASHTSRNATLVVLVSVLLSYIGGAATASALGDSPLYLFAPPTVLAASSFYTRHDSQFQSALTHSRDRLKRRPSTNY